MKNYYSLRSYWAFLSRFKLRLIVVFAVFSLSSAFLAVIPIFLGRLVGSATDSIIITSEIWKYVIFLIAASSLHDITWRLAEFSFLKLMLPLSFWYENGIFRIVIDKPYPYFVGKFTGKTATYITNLRKELDDLIDTVMFNYASILVGFLAVIAILFTVNIATGIVFLVGIFLMFIIGRITIKNNMKYESRYTDVNSTKNGKIIDVMSNFVNVKSFRKEQIEHKNLVHEQKSVIDANARSFKWAVVFWSSMSLFVRHLIWPVTIVMNVRFFLNGSITAGELTTFLSTILIFSNFVWELIWHVSQFGLRAARIEEAHRYLFGKNVVRIPLDDSEVEEQSVVFEKALELKDITFAYPDQADQVVLDNVSLNIKKGEKIGIVGKSGSGKTTLVKLLLGYYEFQTGSINLDGVEVSEKQLLSVISYVPQDTTLFNRTIAENIAYAVDQSVTRREIEIASKGALADEFIVKITEKYDAIVGERGVKLSTGQRQRIAIARAMLQDKPLLILDEATSALDSENEMLVQKSLENLWENRTVISIAHRLSTLKKMDRIIVFDKGRIAEDGTIKQLLDKKGKFYDLWNHQVDGMIIE